ncbi:unnamed protein product, partial [Brenthis ino]
MSENEISEISGTDFEDSGSEYTPSDKENQRNRHRSRKKLVIPESSDESSVEEANDGISSKEVAEDDSVCKSRKRKRNVWNWKKEKAKRARAFGQAYLNVKGSSVPAKIFNSEDCVCIHKCHTKLSMEERRKIIDDFYALGNYNLQSAFIFGLVKVTNKLRTYTAQICNRRI